MKNLAESLFDSKTQTMIESLFDKDLVTNLKQSTLLDLVKGHVKEIRTPYGVPLIGMFQSDAISTMRKQYGDVILPNKRYASHYKKYYGILNIFFNYLLSNIIISNLNKINFRPTFRWVDYPELEEKINKISKFEMKVQRLIMDDNFSIAIEWKKDYTTHKQAVVNIYFDEPIEFLISQINEGLFDDNLVNDDVTTLYDLFGDHIKKFQHTYGTGLGWTHFFDQTAVVREWKKEGRPELKGGFSKTTFPPDLQKFIAVILKNTIISKEQIIKMSEDGNLDDEDLNDILDKSGILFSEESKWGASASRHLIRVQIGYIEGIPANPYHGIQHRQVGMKRFKGLNTENIEISIYAYDPKRPGFGCHIWTILTDISLKDLLYKK